MPGRLLHLPSHRHPPRPGDTDIERANGLLLLFLQHRWMGLEPILYGDQVRQACLDDWIFQGTLDVEHLPADDAERPV